MVLPKYSIITSTYNSQQSLATTIESILDQKGNNFEYIIIDGKSTDKTVEIIKSFEKEFLKRTIKYIWISEKDSGIYEAFNKGLTLSKGEWVSFVGSDDVLKDSYLKEAEKFLEKNQPELLSFKGEVVKNGISLKEVGDPWNWSVFKKEMKVVHIGAFHHQNYFKKFGKFNESYKIAGDYEMLLRARNELRTGFIDNVLVSIGDEGISKTQIKRSLLEAKKAKTSTGSRSRLLAEKDFYWVFLKIKIKEILGIA